MDEREDSPTRRTSRRAFARRVGLAAGAAASALTAPSIASAESAVTALSPDIGDSRIREAFNLRIAEAREDASQGAAVNVSNGDTALYPDKGGTFTKALPHDAYGRVDLNAFGTLMTALSSGTPADFENITMGGTRTLNGPQGGLCMDLEVPDAVQFGQPEVPPAPGVASDQTAAELVEHYWASLLRDVPFTAYGLNALATQAAAELSSLPGYQGPKSSAGQVTTGLLFRGGFPGESLGPYVSQFLLQPTFFGSQPITQQQMTYLPNIDYATDFPSWLSIQNGVDTGLRNQMDPVFRYRRNGRDLASLTHMDVLFQEYFTAFLVLASINPTTPGSFTFGGAPLNSGNPYGNSKTQNGFGTFGGPDMSAAIEEVAVKALNAVWYQKWFVHLRPRPEAIGGIVHLLKTGQQSRTDVRLSNVVLNSQGLQQSFNKYGTWLLSQAFPEGSPTHPAYPTGHGTVAGACITVLKFFYDGSFVIPNPVVSSADGLSLAPYTGADAAQLTVNGELNKLGHNVSFGHGIHAGIHWRSDTDTSLAFGEAVALSFLRNRARTYNEPFTAQITKFDGTTATISNMGEEIGGVGRGRSR
ncbi:MAG TPA: vanadium-dependent haloperoxidase [Bryobacteraceae bacterium]|nr:vanadium-dependent haloperoxidase [Bryobacteraceae bacterium]